MASEAKTSSLFRSILKEKGYYDDKNILVEEQQSDNKKIDKLLLNASKTGIGKGYPDFIITSALHSDLVIIVECKASTKMEKSPSLQSYKDYAVDGALLYASFLAKEYDVIAIGFSGSSKLDMEVEHYIQLKDEHDVHHYFKDGTILDFNSYFHGLSQSNFKFNQDFNHLIDYTREINEELQGKKIKERLRALLISGILISLKNDSFKANYREYPSTDELTSHMFQAIKVQLEDSDVPERNKKSLVRGYEFITTNPSINNPSKEGKEYLTNLITNCDDRINGFNITHKYIDTISQFYVEFLRYANNDKGLGIVLTPPHITELFCELAGVNKDSVVLDNTAGTGGFLVSAMKKMLEDANGDIAKEKEIKDKQLLGIEYDEEIYTLLISNMIVHRDGRTNIINDDCFKVDSAAIKQKFHPNVGLLNPPYKNKGKGIEELEYVLNNLSMLEKGGTCVAIIPISCVNDTTGESSRLKAKIMENNTVEGVLSLPEELFANSKVNTVTCAIVLTAGIPHPGNKKTWLGYCRDDGFVKKKNRGRIDANHRWKAIKDKWVEAFVNREVINEFSVMQKLKPTDEWCAEAYLQPDYTKLTEKDFLNTVKNYYLFNLNCSQGDYD